MRNARVTRLLCLMVVVLWSRLAVAQTTDVGELVTDRPDFTESSVVVGPGMMQLETGSSLEFDGSGDGRSRTLTTPLALMRMGISKTVELRFSSDGDIFTAFGQGPSRVTTNGLADIEVGAKWVFLDRKEQTFAMAMIPMVSVPLGSSVASSGYWDPMVKLTWAKSLSRGFELSGNYNVARLGDDLGRYTEQAHSVSLAHDLVGGWGMYWEGYGFVTTGRPVGQAWTVNSGVTHGLGANAQFDVEVGRGVTAAAPDWFIGVGMGIRTAALRRVLQ